MEAVVSLHGELYQKEYGWDESFMTHVSGPLSGFADSTAEGQRIWIVEKNGVIAGCIAIVRASDVEAQLRWFLLHPDLRGRGIGKFLMDEALGFCRAHGYRSVFLWTEAGLKAAARLYQAAGFVLTDEQRSFQWGTEVCEQRYEIKLQEEP